MGAVWESLFVCFQIRLTTAKTQVEATETIFALLRL